MTLTAPTPDQVRRIVSRYLGGESMAALAGVFRISVPRVKRVLVDQDVPLRATGGASSKAVARRGKTHE